MLTSSPAHYQRIKGRRREVEGRSGTFIEPLRDFSSRQA
jgi:hypothetical protein